MFTLGIATDGYLSKQNKTLAIASNGYLDFFKIDKPIENKQKGSSSGYNIGTRHNIPQPTHKTNIAEYLSKQKKLQGEDDEILSILKMFLQCQ